MKRSASSAEVPVPDDVGMARMPGGFLDHVKRDPAETVVLHLFQRAWSVEIEGGQDLVGHRDLGSVLGDDRGDRVVIDQLERRVRLDRSDLGPLVRM